ncbi:hypothetical protein BDW59DRAFT_180784 [Aspergillus cavernicola]|uniref:Rhodopsin domain-containing protein n=1 Tax=Aspergillus cavernicola TaxID=176166 RepID=A0ABR4I6F1_9EURO
MWKKLMLHYGQHSHHFPKAEPCTSPLNQALRRVSMARLNASASDQRPSVLAGTISTLIIATLFVAARMFTRLKLIKRLSWDDGLIFLAWVLAFGLSFSICYGTSKGIGLHFTNIPPEWLPQLGPSIYAFTVLYYPAVMVTKASILVLYLRIFGSNKFATRGAVLIIVIITFAYVSLTFVKAFRCQPISAAWQLPAHGTVKCIDIVIIHLASTPVNVVTDFAIIMLPIPILTNLRLPRRQKILLILTFALAAFDLIVSIIRIVFLEQALLRKALQSILQGFQAPVDPDITYSESLAFMWSAVEVNIMIVCACMLALKPLVVRIFPHALETSRSKSSSGGGRSARDESSRAEGNTTSTFKRNPDIYNPALRETADLSQIDYSVSCPSTVHSAQAGSSFAMQFITTPELNNMSSYPRRALIPQQAISTHPRLFRFIHIPLPSQHLMNLSVKESYLPLAIMTVLFLILKFLVKIMDIHINQVLAVLQISPLRGVQLQATFFTGYLVGPLIISRFTLSKSSLHTSLLTGLLLFVIAPQVFWPTVILLSLPGMIVSYFVFGVAVSVVYNAIFAFVLLCGPFQHSVLRFLLLQGVGNIGELFSSILSTEYIFPANPTETTILNAQWTFLGATFLVVFLAICLFYIHLPGVFDEDLSRDAEYILGVRQKCIFLRKEICICKWDVVYTTLALGVFSAFCYSGFNSVVSYFFLDYVRSMAPHSALNDRYIGWIAGAALVAGQLAAAAICHYVRPSWVLLLCCLTNIILSTLIITVEGVSGVVIIVVGQLFSGPVFPLLFSISLSGLGRHTLAASTYLTATLSAGALFIPITHFVQKRPSANPIQYSFCVALACSCFGIAMPLFINISRAARKQVNRCR